YPDNQQDPIRFKNLVKTLEHSLRQQNPTREVRPLLRPFSELASDYDFWNHTQDGLAVLCAPDLFRIYKLHRRVPELAIVADSFPNQAAAQDGAAGRSLSDSRPKRGSHQALRRQSRRSR